MKGKKILIGISGSIAAYKIPDLVRLFTKAGAEVKIIMTPSAKDFVSPLVLSTLSKNDVLIEMFDENTWSNHVMLGRWADVFLIAPLSCNTLAKMSKGICDNFLLAVYLSATCKTIVAPAMDEDMWQHPTTSQNLDLLKSYDNEIIPSEYGELASGLIGFGRMAEPQTIYNYIKSYFEANKKLINTKAVVTAGPTYENLDPVRFIGNYSSGKMGIAIAEALADEGCEVTLVLGPSNATVKNNAIDVINVRSAEEMFNAVTQNFEQYNIAIMSAAVADYTPNKVSNEKIKKKEDSFNIELKKTKDILKHLGSIKTEKQILVGFALENHNEEEYALKKLKEKNANFIVLNSLKDEGAGFAKDTNKITIYDNKGNKENFELKSKIEVAKDIVNKIISLNQ